MAQGRRKVTLLCLTAFFLLISGVLWTTIKPTLGASPKRVIRIPLVQPAVNPDADDQNEPRKLTGKTEEIRFAGIAAKSAEEVVAELGELNAQELVGAAAKLRQERLHSDAAVLYRYAVRNEKFQTRDRSNALSSLVGILSGSEPEELEKLLEETLLANPDNWRLAVSVARCYNNLPTTRFLVDGEYSYKMTNGAERYDAGERQRIRRLQILTGVLPLVRKKCEEVLTDADSYEVASFYDELINGFARPYWMRQELTNLDELPDYELQSVVWGRHRGEGAPVTESGAPLFFHAPDAFENAANDGERVQALRDEAIKAVPSRKSKIQIDRADEARALFGVETLASYRFFSAEEQESAEAGVWSLSTLKDSETIAKLAGGIKRFELPEDYDYLALYHDALEDKENFRSNIWKTIAREYESRRQFEKAAETWRGLISVLEDMYKKDPTGWTRDQLKQAKNSLSQIVDPRVLFDAAASKVAGKSTTLVLRSRNAESAKLTIRALKIESLLKQFESESFHQDHYASVQARVNELLEAEALGDPITDEDKLRAKNLNLPKGGFIGDVVATVDVPLSPLADHTDALTTVDLPELAPGAYLVDGLAKDGPEASKDYVVVWTRDVAIVKKQVEAGMRYFLLDAESGAPRTDAELEFLEVIRTNRNNGKQKINVKKSKKNVDKNGSVFVEIPERRDADVMTITVAKTRDANKKTLYSVLDSEYLWRVPRYSSHFYQRNAFFVSDRPIYRPNQKAEFKFWVGSARYDAPEDVNEWAGKEVAYIINSPTGEEVVRKEHIVLDKYGAFADSFDLPADAKLGVYYVQLGVRLRADGGLDERLGSGSFRLEEYRKPEYKVTVDAPKDPILLGDSFKATVRADYYFGAPVANAKVSYKVTRTQYQSTWFPERYWDWFYGCGYWQFAYDAPWYPGWNHWGCPRILPFYRANSGVPEVVSEGEGTLNEDGTFEVEIDSSLAKLLYPNNDQTYEIQAEVVDDSRRSIVGKGKVYATRTPFTTTVWFDRGYYKTNDKMTASFQARRLDGKPVVGDAVVKLYKVRYEGSEKDEVKPIEEQVFESALKTDEEGCGSVEISAAAPGQYRLSCVVTTADGLRQEGGQLVTIAGATDKTASVTADKYRFNSLEIIPEKPEYAVGETARIQFTSNRPDAFVVLFLRTEHGFADNAPIYLKLENGIGYYDLPIEQADQPNIFVEASTVFGGELVTELKELAVPPAKRVLDVAVTPEKDRVKPGEKAKVRLKLTDPDGKPVVGQTVVTVYDASLDALAGGSNVGDIREFFWKWRRQSNENVSSNLTQATWFDVFGPMTDNMNWDERLQTLGAFGHMTATGSSAMNGVFGGGAGFKSLRMNAAPMMARARLESTDDMVVEEEESVIFADAAPMMAMAKMEEAPMAMAMSAAAPEAFNDVTDMAAAAEDGGAADAEPEYAEATVRKNLADVAYWAADLLPNDDGEIEIEIDMPENLTTWKIGAWSVGAGLRVGSGEAEIVTSKDVIVRMEKPRFLTRGDEAVLSAIVHNYSDEAKSVKVSLEFPTDNESVNASALRFADEQSAEAVVEVPVNGQTRVDWTVNAVGIGDVNLLMKALASGESDAIQDTLTVNEHGIDKQLAFSGYVPTLAEDKRKEKRGCSWTFVVPEERREDDAKLVVRVSPTLAGAMLDAIPYLTEYPYGCTEQTLNKFLPAVVAQKALLDLGVDLESIRDKKANLNAQEIGDPAERKAQWSRVTRKDPIFDTAETRKIVSEGVAKLQSMQNADGGWAWFYGPGATSSARLTALVTRGLKLAQECDYPVDQNVIDRGVQWLRGYEHDEVLKAIRGRAWTDEQKREKYAWNKWKSAVDGTDAFVYYALSETGATPAVFEEGFVDYEKADFADGVGSDFNKVHAIMREMLWDDRDKLELYTLATFGLAIAKEQETARANGAAEYADADQRVETILRVFKEYRAADDENQTVWLDLNRRAGYCWWTWFGSEFETQAYYLRLLVRTNREVLEKLEIAGDAPRLVKYLLNNRKHATYWNSTRDTAVCVETFAEYLSRTDELKMNQKIVLKIDGEVIGSFKYTPETLFDVDGTLEAPLEMLNTGVHTLTFNVDGEGPLYCNAYYQFYSMEDPIGAAGLEVKATRNYYKLVEVKDASTLVEGGRGQAVQQRVEKFERVPLQSGDEIKSGDIVEVELLVESKNDYESIMIRDAKAAGMEAVEAQSGYRFQNGVSPYVEFRDAAVCFFVEALPQGTTRFSYKLRAETPGVFSALPTTVEGMYAPELKGNSDEFKTKIVD